MTHILKSSRKLKLDGLEKESAENSNSYRRITSNIRFFYTLIRHIRTPLKGDVPPAFGTRELFQKAFRHDRTIFWLGVGRLRKIGSLALTTLILLSFVAMMPLSVSAVESSTHLMVVK